MTQASDGATDPIDSAVRKALADLDSEGRLTAPSARVVRRDLARMHAVGRSFVSWEPEQLLGPFDRLPREVQHAIVETIEAAERWRLRGRQLGKWHPRIVRLIGSLRTRRIARKLPLMSEAIARGGPRRILSGMYSLGLKWQGQISPRPTIGSLLCRAGIDPWRLAVCYAHGLAQPAGYQGFWHDKERHVTVGSLLGIDLIPSPQGYWFVESNLDVGDLGLELTAAMHERDPLVLNLIDFAQAEGYDHLVVMASNYTAVNDLMARQFEGEAAARGIRLTILEDVFLRKTRYPRRERIPELERRGTLVARMKFYQTNLDYIFHHKTGSHRALRLYRERTGDSEFLLPKTGPDPQVSPCDPRDPFPNLVYKLPERDSGTGVFFLKATSPEQARSLATEATRLAYARGLLNRLYAAQEDHNGSYQPYLRGSLLDGRRLYKIRANVLVTPVGTRLLSAHRVVSSRPVPEELPPGIVRDQAPYLVNYSRGARYAIIPAEEEPLVQTAALAVARGLSWAAAYGFQTSPSG